MKIIAKTINGYLVEAGGWELDEICAGECSVISDAQYRREIPCGTEFHVSAAWRRLRDLKHRQEEVAKAAASFRAFADLLDGSLTVLTVPPEPQPEKGTE